jgi:hypothetical protein
MSSLVILVAAATIAALAMPAHPAQSQPAAGVPADRSGSSVPTPFGDSDGQIPADYPGKLFRLSHDYPTVLAPLTAELPWRRAIGDHPITKENAAAYAGAVKEFMSPRMRHLFFDYASRDARAEQLYNEPWIGYLREPIHGLYVGKEVIPSAPFRATGLTKNFSSYVLTYYDERAAISLARVWGKSAMNPAFGGDALQFPEGSTIVKAQFTTANADVWPVMQGAIQWPVYIMVNATTGDHRTPQIDQSSLIEFDVMIKDAASAPRTGWTFVTFVYDKNAPGADGWDKMVPLGAMWGNDPEVNSAASPHAPLEETWINAAAPAYSKMTLGWGGRLAGPNDGAVNDIAVGTASGTNVAGVGTTSCLSCHGAAEWPSKSFLMPATTNPAHIVDDRWIVMWQPGSPDWMRWFQNRQGDEPQDAGAVAFNYDLVYVHKSLAAWELATKGTSETTPERNYDGHLFRTRRLEPVVKP